MHVDEVFKQAASQGTAPVSFEMFPPKGELTLDTAREAVSYTHLDVYKRQGGDL